MNEPLFARPSRRTVRVALPVPIDSLFSYRVPDSETAALHPGQRVLVPFSGRRLAGVVVEVSELDPRGKPQHTEIDPESPARFLVQAPGDQTISEDIERILDPTPVLSAKMLTLLLGAAEEVLCPAGLALAAALPAGSSPRTIKRLALTPLGEEARRTGVTRGVPARVLDLLTEAPIEAAGLLRRLPEARGLLDQLLGDGLLRQVDGIRGPTARIARERVAQVSPGVDVEARCQTDLARAPKQANLLRALASHGPTATSELAERMGAQPAQLRSLIARGLAETFERDAPRNVLGPPVPLEAPLPLTDDQARVLEPVTRCIRESRNQTFLLHGVTGSGKTEIYLRAVAAALEAGRQALILVPEISLTHQIVARLRARFGDGLAVLHSGLQPGERLEQWHRLRAGDTSIAVGARSALFAPLSDIGIIVIDEEHDSAYKNEQGFRYHAGRLAERLAELSQCPVILGSATPALENRYRADRGEIERIVLARRIGGRPLPAVEIVNMEDERRRTPRGRKLILSKALRLAMQETLAESAQSILFLNRRGFSTRIFCFDCGFAEHCPHCDVALVYHATQHCLRCHYCEFVKPPPDQCGQCGNTDTALLGTGTERLEEEIRAFLPAARTARLDRDSAQRRGHVRAVLDGLAAGDIDILVGTQMIAKGHDFPGVRLVGVVAADLGLHMPDFRAAERCFQVLTQVAGRAGRAQAPGRVILQSFLPDHYAIRPVRNHDYETFYREELGYRASLGYPPFGRISQIIVSGENLDETRRAAEKLADAGRETLGPASGDPAINVPPACEVLGPVPAAFPRLRGRHRQQIVVKGSDTVQVRAVSQNLARLGRRAARGLLVSVDVNPVDML
ncbi:MAG TPA: primosomal protein N' [Myxococcales bacterium]|nr:primosomal protein N' [Myxococcales bacterium]